MQWEEFAQADQEEPDSILEHLGCGEELAQGNGLDWQVGLEQREVFNFHEGQGSVKLLSYCKVEEEMQRVEGLLQMEEERKEVGVNGKTRPIVTPVDSMSSSTYSFNKQLVCKDGINRNKTRALVMSDKTYNDVFTKQKFLNGFYPNNMYINGLNTDALTSDRTDILTMFPEVCDAGEALADADGFLECDLFDHIEPSWKSGDKNVGNCGETVMLSVEEESENRCESLSTFSEEGSEAVEEQEQKEQVKKLLLSRNSHSDPTVYPKSEKEAEILSEFSEHCFSSFCSSESEVTSDEVESTETRQTLEIGQYGSETEQSVSSEFKAGDYNTPSIPSVSSIVSLHPEQQKSQQMPEYGCDGQEVRLLSPSNQNQRNQSSASDTDGYVDMSSLSSFQSKSSANEQETESAYTICSPMTVNCSRAFYTVKELLDSEAQDQKEGIADIFLTKKSEFSVFSSFLSQHDSKVRTMEQMENTQLDIGALKQQLLQVIVRVLQYSLILTDYKDNLSQGSREYEHTQAALVMVSDVADQAKTSLKNGADLLRLVNIEHSVQGLKNLLQPGRVFVKEGTLMKVSRKCKQPRHLFLMSDIMLYTYPQQDGKYRLINTLSLTGMEVTRHLIENTQNTLKIEVKDISITLLASSSIERDDWFVTLNRTVADLGASLEPPGCFEVVCRDCCRNKVPLKYMKNRRAKVCDKCYSELCKN
ncbi:hypothetical protein QTP86_006572, partial [Hemibagrus guttatus]